MFFNYIGTFSIVLLTLVDADYKFTCVDIGSYGSSCDGAFFKTFTLGQTFMNDELDMPGPKSLPNFPEEGQVTYCIVADEALPLCINLIRPYPQGQRFRVPIDERVFNYRLSCACCIVGNAFGIWAQRFRVFKWKLCLKPDNVDRVIKSCVVLDNYLMENTDLPTIYNCLNPDNDPYLTEDRVLLDIPHLGRISFTCRS